MSVMHELKIFMQDIGSEFPMLGKELSKIAKYTAQQIKEDPIKYLRDSAQDLSDMGLYHPSFEALGVETDYIPDWAKSAVKPVEGSILYTDLVANYAQHSGVYIGDDQIVELNREGEIRIVSPEEFIGGGTGIEIYVSCHGNQAVGSSKVAKRARKRVGQRRNYNPLLDNCHQFVSACLSKSHETEDNFLWMLKSSAKKHLAADNWRIWNRF